MKKPTRLILGGAFDPFHNGHLAILTTLYQQLSDQVSCLHLIPTGHPVHKSTPTASIPHRIAMLTLICEQELKQLTSLWHYDIELYECQKNSPSFTVDTLQHLHQKFPDSHFSWIIGDDQYFRFHTWHTPESILKLANLLVINRQETQDYRAYWHTHFPNLSFTDSVTFSYMPLVPLSSQEIRSKILANQPIDRDVPLSIVRYIESKKLY